MDPVDFVVRIKTFEVAPAIDINLILVTAFVSLVINFLQRFSRTISDLALVLRDECA